MKNLKLLNKNYYLVILFSLFFGFTSNSQEPVDIWEIGEKKPDENVAPIEAEVEKSQVVKGRSSAGRAGTFNKKGKSQRSAKF